MMDLSNVGKRNFLIHLTSVIIAQKILLFLTIRGLNITLNIFIPENLPLRKSQNLKLRLLALICFSPRMGMTSFNKSFMTSVMSLVFVLLTFHFCMGIFHPAHHMLSAFHRS